MKANFVRVRRALDDAFSPSRAARLPTELSTEFSTPLRLAARDPKEGG
jgi:hypothetical protein